ncbi:unnamed protein product, partial [Prorocentrum cordatum]
MFVPVGAPPRRRPLRQGLCKVAALLSLALAALSFLSGAESPQALISVACADNSGAWELKILACKKKGRTVRNYKLHEVAPGDMVVVIGRTSGAPAPPAPSGRRARCCGGLGSGPPRGSGAVPRIRGQRQRALVGSRGRVSCPDVFGPLRRFSAALQPRGALLQQL